MPVKGNPSDRLFRSPASPFTGRIELDIVWIDGAADVAAKSQTEAKRYYLLTLAYN